MHQFRRRTALPSSPPLAASALPSPFFLTSIPEVLDFCGFCWLLGTISPTLPDSALRLPSCRLTSIVGILGVDTGHGFCRPVGIAPALAEFALPLLSCFSTSYVVILVIGAGDRFCLPIAIAPVLTEFALPLLSCFSTSCAAIFGVGASEGFFRPVAIAPVSVEFGLFLGSCLLTSLAGFVGPSTGSRIGLRESRFSSTAILGAGGGSCPALLLPSCFPTSSVAIFRAGTDDGFCPPIAIAPVLPKLALPLPSCSAASNETICGVRVTGNGF